MSALRDLLSLEDFEAPARRFLPRPIFGFIAGAVETNATLRDNRDAFTEWGFVPRMLRNVSRRSMETTVFGRTYAAPFGVAPMGIAALAAYRGDLVLARAAAANNVPMLMSGSSLIRMEDVRAENPAAWFQAYLPGESDKILALVERVGRAGFETLIVTVDTAVKANRENNVKSGFATPLRPSLRLAWDGITRPRWLIGTALRTLATHGMPHFENSSTTRGAPIFSGRVERDFGARDHLHWEHLELIRRHWPGKLVVKGILHKEDARIARDSGVDGIIVSNHGGRQLDYAVSPLRVLPAIVDAVGPDYAVMLDSGVRRGTDVLKALALGAKFVFVGRPFLYAASIAGEAGASHAIRLLAEEISRDMGLLGLTALNELDKIELVRLKKQG